MITMLKSAKTALAGLAVAGATVLALASGAAAAGAEARTTANVRSGPSTGYAIVDSLYAGEDVNIDHCNSSGSWCYITHPGPDGWVATSLLRPVGGTSSGSGSTANNCTFQLGPHGFRLQCGGSSVAVPLPGPAPTPSPVKKVCVYNGPNYTGAHICRNAGAHDNSISGFWNNRISSLKVFGGAHIKLCQNPGYGGFCNTFHNNVSNLGFALNNKASSYAVW